MEMMGGQTRAPRTCTLLASVEEPGPQEDRKPDPLRTRTVARGKKGKSTVTQGGPIPGFSASGPGQALSSPCGWDGNSGLQETPPTLEGTVTIRGCSASTPSTAPICSLTAASGVNHPKTVVPNSTHQLPACGLRSRAREPQGLRCGQEHCLVGEPGRWGTCFQTHSGWC